MNESHVLAEVSNENQTLVAVVQQDHRAAYFYIYPTEENSERFQVRACWLRNLAAAPQQEDSAALALGQPPMLAAEFCRNLEGEAPLNPEGLTVVWTESDDGAALWYYGQLLAVIPGWSLYIDHSVCYSASCIKESPLAFRSVPLPPIPSMHWRKVPVSSGAVGSGRKGIPGPRCRAIIRRITSSILAPR